MDHPCYTAPTLPECASFIRGKRDLINDIMLACEEDPSLVGCALYAACQVRARAGQAGGQLVALGAGHWALTLDRAALAAARGAHCSAGAFE